jgi:aldose 1-epimerase
MGREPGVATRLATALLLAAFATGWRPTAARQAGASPDYSARHTGAVVELHDDLHDTTVSILPTHGNLTVEMKVKGHNVLRFPFTSAADYKGGAGSIGIPFLAPWADRPDEQAFYANGRRYAFDMSLGNVRGTNPIHGFLTSAPDWNVVEVRSDGQSAWVTSTLEFFRHPAWMKQFPFAHTIAMTHRLRDGVLEVSTRLDNLSVEPMPVAIGFHPFFQLTDSPRDAWTLSVAARTHWPVSEAKMPAGTTQPIDRFFADPTAVRLAPLELDDVFSDLVRDARGMATMSLQGKAQRLDVVLGTNYRAVVVYAPKPAPGQEPAARNFVCIEPVAGIINALNLAHKGVYKELQSITPGGVWQESFWIRPNGF